MASEWEREMDLNCGYLLRGFRDDHYMMTSESFSSYEDGVAVRQDIYGEIENWLMDQFPIEIEWMLNLTLGCMTNDLWSCCWSTN